jgi:hypothetical protein
LEIEDSGRGGQDGSKEVADLSHKSSSHTCKGEWLGLIGRGERRTHVSEIAIQDFDVAMDDLERHELVVSRGHSTDEEERSVSPVDNLRI